MDAVDYLKQGDVSTALDLLKQDVRKAPRDPRLRTFLFQMFCITAEWDRALAQLAVAAELDPLALPMQQAYQVAIRCEVLREKVFRGERTPTLFGQPGPWVPLLIEANRLLAAGQGAKAASLRDAAFEQAPASAGSADGAPFEWIADADPRLGPVLEAFVDGTYYWVPFAHVRRIDIEPPADLRDQVWMPARFLWANNGESVGFIPTRYPAITQQAESATLLSRRTDWIEVGAEEDGWLLGSGQRMFGCDTGEIALMDLRRLDILAPGIDTPELVGPELAAPDTVPAAT